MAKLEIERKFLIKFPTSWAVLAELFDDLIDVKRISQTYLKPEGNEPSARVRKTVEGLTGDTNTVYHYNKKKLVQEGLKNAHPDKVTIEKTRFVFNYNDQTFELDVFKGPLKGLAILELELKDKNQKIELPPFLDIIKEVTEDKSFNNFSLADKKLHNKLSNILI
jgi:CYTH domain-containing protein